MSTLGDTAPAQDQKVLEPVDFTCMPRIDLLRLGERQLQEVLSMFKTDNEFRRFTDNLKPLIRAVQKKIVTRLEWQSKQEGEA